MTFGLCFLAFSCYPIDVARERSITRTYNTYFEREGIKLHRLRLFFNLPDNIVPAVWPDIDIFHLFRREPVTSLNGALQLNFQMRLRLQAVLLPPSSLFCPLMTRSFWTYPFNELHLAPRLTETRVKEARYFLYSQKHCSRFWSFSFIYIFLMYFLNSWYSS